MEKHDCEEVTREEIKKEFQLERMILFSDAVFAIVITLMAIEIKIPESETITAESLPKALFHLMPTVLAYIVSFCFIGAIWYQHLRMFSLLKDYDKGLVVRNMILLFFIGLFPFSATLISRGKGQMLPFFIYLSMILFCTISQYVLYHYIIKKRPSLRLNTDISDYEEELHKRKVAVIGFAISAVLTMVTYLLIPQDDLKPLSMFWVALYAIIFRIVIKKRNQAFQKVIRNS